MKLSYRNLFWICTALAALACLFLLSTEVDESRPVVVGANPIKQVVRRSLTPSLKTKGSGRERAVVDPIPAPPPVSPMTYEALAKSGVEMWREETLFEEQTWEPDLHQAFDLPANVLLKRRSIVYQVDGFPYERVRVDTVEKAVPKVAEDGTPMEEPLWQNAMIADHLMVQLEPEMKEADLRAALPQGARIRETMTRDSLYLVEIPAEGEHAIEVAVAALNELKGVVQFAEPDFLSSGADTIPNDPLYSEAPGPQWHLPHISAPRAWDVVKEPRKAMDAATTIVAIVDTGVDITHPDLAANIWRNPNEVGGSRADGGDGVDDDANGYKDDLNGWNFVDKNNSVKDDVGHGTHVAGIVGAIGNNAMGVTGVCWNVKILPIRIIKKQGTGTYGTYSAAVNAMNYLRELNRNGRRVAVANHSWGGVGYSLAMLNAINNPVATADPVPMASSVKSTFAKGVNELVLTGDAAQFIRIRSGMAIKGTGIPANTLVTIVKGATIYLSNYTTVARKAQVLAFSNPVLPKPYGMIHVAAAGNKRQNCDRIPTYPACTPSGFVLSVGASDQNDAIAVWPANTGSNFGPQTVDLFAPGSGIWSTKMKLPTESGYGYESRSGTSMSVPMVSGAAALLTMWQTTVKDQRHIKQIIMDNVQPIPSMSGQCASGGRLNLARILDRLYQPILVDSAGSTGGGSATTSAALSIGLGLSGQVAKGDAFTLAIREGRVSSWGWGYYGQTPATGATGYAAAVPAQVANSDDAVMVAAAGNTGLMLKSDGSVWAWGGNHDGLLSNGSTDFLPHPQPSQIGNLWPDETPFPQATWLSAGGHIGSSHVTVVNADGTVMAWGRNEKGQLGDGTLVDRFSPVTVPGLDEVVMTAVGTSFTLALKQDGTVWQWGRRPGASAATAPNLAPIQVATAAGVDLSEVTYIAAGYETAYAVKEDGSVWWWGVFDGDESQAEYSMRTDKPMLYQELSDIVAIAAGDGFALGVDAVGRVYAWGRNDVGQLGAGLGDPASRPVQIPNLGTDGVGAIAAGRDSSVVLLGSGRVAAWGRNQRGELGSGRLDESLLPVQVPGLYDIVTARAGRAPAAAAKTQNGTWYFWGESIADPDAQTPAVFTKFSPMADLETCPNHDFTLARKTDGSLWTWGKANAWGELGGGAVGIAAGKASPDPTTPVAVKNVSGALSFSVSPGVYSDTVGNFEPSIHCLAVNKDGTVRAWGGNLKGQLGDGTTAANRATPVTVAGLTGIVEVSAGGAHSLARRSDGTVWAWGNNAYGQLGNGSTVLRTAPVQVSGLAEIIQIKACRDSNVALKADGSVWVWGAASGITSPANLGGDLLNAVRVLGVPALRSMDAGGDVFMGIDASGSVWAWSFYSGLLGRRPSTPGDPWAPGLVEGLSQISSLSVGENSAFAVRADGTLWAWGNGETGFLGDGSAWSTVPVSVVGFGGVSESLSNEWQQENFSSDELRSRETADDTADPDGDRIPNLIEYALGLDPNTASTFEGPAPQVDVLGRNAGVDSAGGVSLFGSTVAGVADEEDDGEPDAEDAEKTYFGLTVPRTGVQRDVEYLVEVSTDLIHWNGGDPYTFTTTDNSEQLLVYSSLALEDMPSAGIVRQFIRLRVRRVGETEGVSLTSTVYSSDGKEVWQFTFGLASSVLSEQDGTTSIVVTANPPPTEAVTLNLNVTGTAKNGASGDFTVATTMVAFAAGQAQVQIPITIHQDALVEAAETIILTLLPPNADTPPSIGLAAIGQPGQHLVTIVDDETIPKVSSQPDSKIVALGESTEFTASFTSSPAPTLQWLKEGAQVGSAKSETLRFAKTKIASGGTYSLRATNALGTVISSSASLAVVERGFKMINLAPGAVTTLKANAGGTDLEFEWLKDGDALPEGGPYAGVDTPILKITGVSTDDTGLYESGVYTCLVKMGELSLDTGETTLRVIDQDPLILEPVELPDVVIGSDYGSVPVPVDPLVRRSPTKYTAKGLPPGLKLDAATGRITGRPTARKDEAYPVTLTVSNSEGTDTATTSIFVHGLAADVDGVYTGFVARDAVNEDLGGKLDLTVAVGGAFSGKLLNGVTSYSFKGSLNGDVDSPSPEGSVMIPRKGLTSLTLQFTLLAGQHRLGDASVADESSRAVITGWRQRWSAKAVPADRFKGYYTWALPAPTGADLPQGAGYASFTVAPAGTLSVAGILADGVKFTTGTFVGPLGEVLIHQAAAGADVIVGSLRITPGVDPNFLDNTLSGSVTWSREPQKASQKIYADGFDAQLIVPFGGRYTEPLATEILMNLDDKVGNARLVFTGADFGQPVVTPDIAIRIGLKGAVTLPDAAANPRKTTLALKPKTGAFSGAITLKDGTVKRSGKYAGFIVRNPEGVERGYGSFLLPEYPASNPAKTDSGLVILEATPTP